MVANCSSFSSSHFTVDDLSDIFPLIFDAMIRGKSGMKILFSRSLDGSVSSAESAVWGFGASERFKFIMDPINIEEQK